MGVTDDYVNIGNERNEGIKRGQLNSVKLKNGHFLLNIIKDILRFLPLANQLEGLLETFLN
jgi:hypothetical protein